MKPPQDDFTAAMDLTKLCAQRLYSEQGQLESPTVAQVKLYHDNWIGFIKSFVRVYSSSTVELKPLILTSLFEILEHYGKNFSTELWKDIFVDGLWHFFDKVRRQTLSYDPEILVESSGLFKVLDGIMSFYDQFELFHITPSVLSLLTDFISSDNEHLATSGTTSFATLIANSGKHFTIEIWTMVFDALFDIFKRTNFHLNRDFIISSTSLPAPAPTPVTDGSTPTPVPGTDQAPIPTISIPTGGPSSPFTPSKSPRGVPTSGPAPTTPTKEEPSRPVKSDSLAPTTNPEKSGVDSKSRSRKSRHQHVLTTNEIIENLSGGCRVRIEVLHLIRDGILNKWFSQLSLDHLRALLDLVQQSYESAIVTLADDELFTQINKTWESKKVSTFIELQNKIAGNSMSCYLDCLFKLEADNPEYQKLAETCLISSCSSVMRNFMKEERKLMPARTRRPSTRVSIDPSPRVLQTISNTVPIVLLILDQLNTYTDEKLSSVLLAIYPLIVDLTISSNYEVRLAVRKLLWRIGTTQIKGFDQPFQEWS